MKKGSRKKGGDGSRGVFPDGQRFLEREQEEVDRRWRDAANEMTQILKHIPDIRWSKLESLPEGQGGERRRWLSQELTRVLLEGETRPELKRSVIRRMADKMGQYLLWNRLSSTPAMHEFYALFPWWVSQLPVVGMDRLRDLGLAYVLNGLVLPVQTVWKELLDAQAVFIGHCVCRSSGIANDLPKEKKFHNLLDQEQSGKLMDRITGRYMRLKEAGDLDGTDPMYTDLLEELVGIGNRRSPRFRLERLLRATYPEWEFLPVHPRYTTDWIRSMYQNRKARPIHKELAFEMATILYFSHGIIFTSMRLMDTPYTICSCPTPERGGGCVLTNWYYYGKSNTSILPNEENPGRNRDRKGFVQPCRYFEARAQRECLGCGCFHDAENPRDLDHFLLEADRILKEHRKKKDGKPEEKPV